MRWKSLWVLLVVHGLVHGTMNIFPVVLEPIRAQFDWSLFTIGWVGTAGYAAFGLMAWPAGYMADRFSRRNLLVVSLGGIVVSGLVIGLLVDPLAFVVGWILLGTFAGLYHPLGLALVAQVHPDHTGKAMGWHGIGGNLGFALMPLVAGVLGDFWGWPAAFLGPAGVAIVPLVGGFLVRPRNRENTDSKESISWGTILLVVLLVYGLVGLIYRGLMTFLPYGFNQAWGGGLDLSVIGGLTTAVLLVGAVGQFAGGILEDRLPSIPTFSVLVAGYSLVLGLLPLVVDWGFLALMAVWCLLFYACQPILNSMVSRMGSMGTHGRLYGYAFLFHLGFGGIGAGFAGSMVDWFGLSGAYVSLAGIGLTVVGISGLYLGGQAGTDS